MSTHSLPPKYTCTVHAPTLYLCVCLRSEAINVPMIPLGLKETKEVDFTLSIQVKTRSRLSFKAAKQS